MLPINLIRESEISIKRQIYMAFRDQILSGKLLAGDPLPSTRELAVQIHVSRNTVCEAYDMLIAEGFISSHQGAPSRVTEGIRIDHSLYSAPPRPEKTIRSSYTADFKTGQPDLRQFPQYLWKRIIHKTSDGLQTDQFGYGDPQGMGELRTEIASWLFRSKVLDIDKADIFITSGATQALHIIVNLLGRYKKKIAIEDPCNKGIMQTFADANCQLEPISVDDNGIRTELLKKADICAVYVTPSHQFPLGGILPATRRSELIGYAEKNGIYIVEDDYDSEFRYNGEPIAPLYAMSPGRVIYVGTFSKVLFPAIRVGYVILPRELQAQWKKLRLHTDVQNPPLEQAALAEFLRTRKFDNHIRKMRKLYGKRRETLLEALKSNFGDTWCPCGDNAGLHIAIEFPHMEFNDSFIKKCNESGIRITSVETHSIGKGFHLNKLLIGYGHLEQKEIRDGISLLHSVMLNCCMI